MKFAVEPVESGADIIDFPNSMIVFTLAQTRAAKIEAHHGKTKTVQRLHGVKHDLVVQRATKQRMRMANDRGMRGVFRACVEQRLQPASAPVDRKRLDGRIMSEHNVQTTGSIPGFARM